MANNRELTNINNNSRNIERSRPVSTFPLFTADNISTVIQNEDVSIRKPDILYLGSKYLYSYNIDVSNNKDEDERSISPISPDFDEKLNSENNENIPNNNTSIHSQMSSMAGFVDCGYKPYAYYYKCLKKNTYQNTHFCKKILSSQLH